jgi:hypothetical protein
MWCHWVLGYSHFETSQWLHLQGLEGARRNRSFLDPSSLKMRPQCCLKMLGSRYPVTPHHIPKQNFGQNHIHPKSVGGGEYKWKRPKINKDNCCVKVKQWKFHVTMMYNLTFPANELVGSVRCVSKCVSR